MVIASQKVAGRNVTVDEHQGQGTVINVADSSTRRGGGPPTPPPLSPCECSSGTGDPFTPSELPGRCFQKITVHWGVSTNGPNTFECFEPGDGCYGLIVETETLEAWQNCNAGTDANKQLGTTNTVETDKQCDESLGCTVDVSPPDTIRNFPHHYPGTLDFSNLSNYDLTMGDVTSVDVDEDTATVAYNWSIGGSPPFLTTGTLTFIYSEECLCP